MGRTCESCNAELPTGVGTCLVCESSGTPIVVQLSQTSRAVGPAAMESDSQRASPASPAVSAAEISKALQELVQSGSAAGGLGPGGNAHRRIDLPAASKVPAGSTRQPSRGRASHPKTKSRRSLKIGSNSSGPQVVVFMVMAVMVVGLVVALAYLINSGNPGHAPTPTALVGSRPGIRISPS